MLKIGDLCPLFFSPMKDKFGVENDYMQTFYVTDKIMLQVFADKSPNVVLENLSVPSKVKLSMKTYEHNSSTTMYYVQIAGHSDGVYRVTVDGLASEPFCVTSDKTILETTTLIRYSHKDNHSAFDSIFWVGETQLFFEWRVEAGFKSSGYTPHVDNEHYRNQFQEITVLYSLPYDSYTLTLGDAAGVPYWFVRHLNRIFCVSYVEIDNSLWVRSEGSVPEITQVLEDYPLFYATMVLEPMANEVSGSGGAPEPGSSASVVGFSITNPTDGQMLQYSEDESAFVNVTTVGV